MSDLTKIRMTALALLYAGGSLCYGQALPTAAASATSDPYLPSLDGIVHYTLTASEIVQFGSFGSNSTTQSTALSGDVSYQGKNAALPFSLLFAGGLLLPNGQGQGVSTYQNIAVSQGLVTRTWVFNVTDSFSFLPQSPATGLSGVAGVGDLGVVPIQGPASGPAGGVLSTSGDQIGNSLSGSAERQLDHATSISGSGSWSVLHFLNSGNSGSGYGLDTTQISGEVGLNRRIDARSSGSLTAVYSVFDYSGQLNGIYATNFQTKGLNFSYQRTLSRALSVGASVGPQWVSSSNSAIIPSSLQLAISANLSYVHRYTHASLLYSRGVNGGSGVIPGALSDTVSAAVGRPYGRDWVVSLTAAYLRTSGLEQFATGASSGSTNVVFNTVNGGVQVTRRISNSLSGFASYTAEHQSYNSLVSTQNAFGGTSNFIGIGITFTPRSTRLGQF